MHDLNVLRQVFLADQAEGAQQEAADRFAVMAGARGADYTRRPSAWVLRLVKRARRHRCAHWPQEGAQVIFLPAHVGQLQCRSCADRTAAVLPTSLDGPRCDLCRGVAGLEDFAFHVGTLLITGRCCAGCRPTVYGGPA